MNELLSFNSVEIQKFQLNRNPMLFLDSAFDVIPGRKASAWKYFSFNEWYFQGHFPDDPNVPSTVQVECLDQSFLMAVLSVEENKGHKAEAVQIDATFKRKIVPGEKLRVEATVDSLRRGVAKGSATGYVNNDIACEAKFTVVLPHILENFLRK